MGDSTQKSVLSQTLAKSQKGEVKTSLVLYASCGVKASHPGKILVVTDRFPTSWYLNIRHCFHLL